MKFRDEIIRGMVRQELSKLNEDVDLSQFPNPGNYGKSWLSKGQRDGSEGDDVVKTKKATIPASKLKPSQSEIFLAKSVGMAIGNMVGGDIGAVISKDNHILDGHHRWAATTLNDPKAKIGGIQAELPIKQLIPILRAAGDALGNARRGMPEGGDVNIFKATVDDIRAACYDGKNMDMQYYNKEKSVAWFEKFGEAELKKRLKAIQAKEPKNAPNRPNMPVIDAKKGEDSLVKKLFNKGDIDVKKPYAKESVQHPLKEYLNPQVKNAIMNAVQSTGYGSNQSNRYTRKQRGRLERGEQNAIFKGIESSFYNRSLVVSKISNIAANLDGDGIFEMTADVVVVYPDGEKSMEKLNYKRLGYGNHEFILENVNSNGTHPLTETVVTKKIKDAIRKVIYKSGYGFPDETFMQESLCDSIVAKIEETGFYVKKISGQGAKGDFMGNFSMTAQLYGYDHRTDTYSTRLLSVERNPTRNDFYLTLENVNSNGTHPLKENYERLFERKDKRLM